MGPAARTSNGNLVPKPMLFFPADPRGITLWRLAAAFNAGDAATAATLFTDDAEFQVNDNTTLTTWKGPAEINLDPGRLIVRSCRDLAFGSVVVSLVAPAAG